jgi:fructose-1,6-bisphosphatase
MFANEVFIQTLINREMDGIASEENDDFITVEAIQQS